MKKESQCIILTGISGAGKTFTTSCLAQFLSSKENANHSKSICQILDAFGNCETTQNHNSSRFVKIVQVCTLGWLSKRANNIYSLYLLPYDIEI